MVTAYRAPKMNAHCERLIGTLRRDLLDHVIVVGENHARYLLLEYADYDNAERCHQALGNYPPRPGLRLVSGQGEVIGRPVLHGLHHTYRRVA
jgi:transposase InsO family protein